MTFIGKRVKERREELGMSQSVLAKRIGVSGPSLSQLESGKIKRSRRINKLAAALKVTPEWLEGGAEEARPAAPADASAVKPVPAAKTNGAARNGSVRAHRAEKANGVSPKIMRLAESLMPLPAHKLKALFVLAGIR